MKMVRKRNALKICYYMMTADGLVKDSEREKFDELGRMIDDFYDSYKEQLIWECRQQGLFPGERELIFLIMDLVDRELKEGITDSLSEDVIPGRLLVWNMLTIALCDKDYDDAERRLVENVVRKLEVDTEDFREMEQTLVAANAVEKEAKFIREMEGAGGDASLQLKNLKERSRVIAANAKEHMTGRM